MRAARRTWKAILSSILLTVLIPAHAAFAATAMTPRVKELTDTETAIHQLDLAIKANATNALKAVEVRDSADRAYQQAAAEAQMTGDRRAWFLARLMNDTDAIRTENKLVKAGTVFGALSYNELLARLDYAAMEGSLYRTGIKLVAKEKTAATRLKTLEALGRKVDELDAERASKQTERERLWSKSADLLSQVTPDDALVMVKLLDEQYSALYQLAASSKGKRTVEPKDFVWPVDGKINSSYGTRTDPFGAGDIVHQGIDIDAIAFTDVVAPAAGKVLQVDWGAPTGTIMIIDHGGGLLTLYAHLSNTAVTKGQSVAQGQRIGWVGFSGYRVFPKGPDGAHLHFGVFDLKDPNRDRFGMVDPLLWLP